MYVNAGKDPVMNKPIVMLCGVYLLALLGCSDPSGPAADRVPDVGPSYLFGGVASISLEKSTNGFDADEAPGPTLTPGDPVTWAYQVTNTGTEELNSVYVLDDMEGFICSIGSLAPGQVAVCEWYGEAQAGAYTNVGTVYGTALLASPQDSDPSHYFGGEAGPGEPAALAVEIRLKPGSDAPCINPRSKGRIPVAILASAEFDPSAIDPHTILAGGIVPPIRWGKGEDVNQDGLSDLVVHFGTRELYDAGLLEDGMELEITGDLWDGSTFFGSDLVREAGARSCR